VFRAPRHPYTKKLIEAIPQLPLREQGAPDLLRMGSQVEDAAYARRD